MSVCVCRDDADHRHIGVCLWTVVNPRHCLTFSESAVIEKFLKLKPDKAQGPDGVHPMVLRECAEAVAKPLAMIYQKSFDE